MKSRNPSAGASSRKFKMKDVFCWVTLGLAFWSSPLYPQQTKPDDAAQILILHKELLQAHLRNDAQGVLAAEPGQIVVVSRGEVLFPSKAERLTQYREYLAGVEFSEYRDLVEPLVRVSQDGTLAWLIVQVKIAGSQLDRQGGKKAFDSVWAWIELYEKRDGRWFRVGEVSNAKPSGS